MLHAALVVLLIGLGDSLNPSMIGPAMYLATVDGARRRLTEFLIGIFAVNMLAGVLIVLGPGQLLLDLVPSPKPTTKHILELVAGGALIVIAVLLWSGRRALGRHRPPTFKGGGRSGVMLGAGIAAVELPTAVPYFAAIAVIIGSGVAVPGKVVGLMIYNVAYLAPVVAILFVLLVFGDAAKQPLAHANRWVLAHWPGVLACVAAFVGTAVLSLGVFGLLSR